MPVKRVYTPELLLKMRREMEAGEDCRELDTERLVVTKELLEREIRLLESGVAVCKTRGLPPHLLVDEDPVLRPIAVKLAGLLCAKQLQQNHIAKIQSTLSQCLMDQPYHPLYTQICLTKDWKERRYTLRAMRESKLRDGYDFVMSRSHLVDPFSSHFSEDRFETEQGDLCCVRFDIIHFPGVASLQQVCDALAFFMTNMEIVISEQLGHVVLRDDYDTIEDEAFHSRFAPRIAVEGNAISFCHVFNGESDGFGSEPCGVFIVDCIDQDELYPSHSSERVRRDSSGAIVLTASRRRSATDQGGELVVTMRRATFLKIRRPEFYLSDLISKKCTMK
ncbi:hypothetical protein PInf_022394 [Phytophthora infestans]|nr:hypothetical protein PInf_022394 [Phytophthora infestans]